MTTPDRPQRSFTYLRIALFVLTLLVAGEVALRVVDAVQGRSPFGAQIAEPGTEVLRYKPHPFLGYALNPAYDGQDINPMGLRGEAVPKKKPKGVYRILCVGGSTTYGSHTPADQAYPARLQELLNKGPHKQPPLRYEVLNCGVPGYTTAESLVNLSLRLLEFDADALIIYHAINDARLIQVGGFQADYSHMRSSWRFPETSPLESALLRHCRLYYRLFKGSYPSLQPARLERLVYVDATEHPHPAPSWKGVNTRGVRAYLRNLRNLIAVAQEHGIAPVLTTFAASEEHLVGPGYGDVLAVMNRWVRQMATNKKLPLIELAESLDDQPGLFADYVHMNADGFMAQAKLIHQQARELGLWRLR